MRIFPSLAVTSFLMAATAAVAQPVMFVQPPGSTPVAALASPSGVLITSNTGVSSSVGNLDVTTVTTGGTYVTAVPAGSCTQGCYIFNFISSSNNICVSETGNAGTSDSATTICIPPGGRYDVRSTFNAVTVNAAANGVAFGGRKYN
jgi:hypothetical protein